MWIYQSRGPRLIFQLSLSFQEAGINTLVELDDQAEKLETIEDGMDSIHEDMLAGEKALEALEACCGVCVLPWDKRETDFDDSAWKDEGPVAGGVQPSRGGEGIFIGNFYYSTANWQTI